MNIELNGINYFIKKRMDEPTIIFSNRCWFISKKEPKTNKEFINIEKASNIWANEKYLNCKYRVIGTSAGTTL